MTREDIWLLLWKSWRHLAHNALFFTAASTRSSNVAAQPLEPYMTNKQKGFFQSVCPFRAALE